MEFRLYPEGYGEPLKVSKQGGEMVRFLQEAVWQGVKEGRVWSQTVLDQISVPSLSSYEPQTNYLPSVCPSFSVCRMGNNDNFYYSYRVRY